MDVPLVSIVVPAYRADAFLPATLDSIVRQSYRAWELIVVEDASCGETETMVAEFGRKHFEQRVVYRRHEENRGQAAARNTAFAEARGEFVAFVDADDLWLPDHLETAVAALRAGAGDLVYAKAIMFDTDSGQLLSLWGPSQRELAAFPGSLYRRSFVTPSTVVLRREVFERVGPFDTSAELRQGCEDLDYWLRCVAAGVRFICLPGCHCLYRKGHGEASTANMPRILLGQVHALAKNLGMPGIPMAEQRRSLARYCLYAAVANAHRGRSRSALSLMLRGWRTRPWRLDYLVLAPGIAGLGLVAAVTSARGGS